MPGWNSNPVPDETWKPAPHTTIHALSWEQDQAAGGKAQRYVKGSNGALGRVVLRKRYRRVYAELRWQTAKREHSKYLCQVESNTRASNLATAWRRAHALEVAGPRNRIDEQDPA